MNIVMVLESPSPFHSHPSPIIPRAPFMERRIRRAAAACYYCHARKVRCDAAILGYPCTNCTLDKRTDCTLRPNATSRFRKLRINQNAPAKTAYTNIGDGSSPADNNPAPQLANIEVQPSIELPWNHDWDILPPTCNVSGNTFPEPTCWLPDFPVNFLDLDRLSTLPMEEVHSISTQGCLEVPTRHVTETFLNKYFLLIHPLLPILDEAQVWGACIQGGDHASPHPKVSLFVFQAILLASSAFVPLEAIHQCGFSDHHTARRTLYNRAKALYDSGFEMDAIARAQGCVLLTFHTTAQDPEATMTWNLCAVQNAITAKVNCTTPHEDPLGMTKKRLYWSIFVRDRILWLGRHRSPHFVSAQFKAPASFLDESDQEEEIGASRVYTPGARRLLIGIFHAQCELAIILTDVISIAFSGYHRYSPRLSADTLSRHLVGVKELRVRLSQWKDKTQSQLAQKDLSQWESIEIITKLIWLHYESARIALAHHETFLVESHVDMLHDTAGGILLNIAKDLKGSVHRMTHVIKFFALRNLTEAIPISVLAYCGTPMILAAIDSKLSPNHSESALSYCSEVVTQSRGAYDITEFFSQGINHLLHLAYRVTDNVFRENLGNSARRGITSSEAVRTSHEERSCLPMTPFKNLRVKGWVEAFLKYPRAYLSISACIDHSLATGRLPRDDVLPPLIRATLPSVLGLPRLPWMIGSPGQDHPDSNAASLTGDSPKTQGEDFTHPAGYSLNDPWYWKMLHNFNPEDEVQPVGPERSDWIHSMVDIDSANTSAELVGAPCPPLVQNYDLPNLSIITGDNSLCISKEESQNVKSRH